MATHAPSRRLIERVCDADLHTKDVKQNPAPARRDCITVAELEEANARLEGARVTRQAA